MKFNLICSLAIFVITISIAPLAEARKVNKFRDFLLSELMKVKDFAEAELKALDVTPPEMEYPYWYFLPQYQTAIKPDGQKVTWSTPCFGNNEGVAVYSDDKKTVTITITSSKAKKLARCDDQYMTLSNAAMLWHKKISVDGTNTVVTKYDMELPADITQSEIWDIETKGFRMMKYFVSGVEILTSLVNTIELFLPEFMPAPTERLSQMNVEYLNKYTGNNITPRDPSLNVVPEETEVKSGDAFYLMRFDGLNPMLAWAMGSTTGHVTTALWIDGALYVCESTTASEYWPTDYIQKTPYRTWIEQVQAAGFQVIWAPLNDQARARYNETAAVDFFRANEGYDYGFKTMIWAWLDTAKGNFPCLPPDFSTNCLQWELLESLIAHVDRRIPEIGYMIWNAGMAKRLNLGDDLRTSEYYYQASLQNLTPVELIQIPEQDTWVYNTTRNEEPTVGREMVCCVFVCDTWKAAGVFGDLADSINCGELTNYDDYALTIHADTYRQIVGNYSLELPGFKTKDAYAHMAEKCSALPPDYTREEGC